VITSPAAALRDVLTTLRRRMPSPWSSIRVWSGDSGTHLVGDRDSRCALSAMC
jgi:hypothetical protein